MWRVVIIGSRVDNVSFVFCMCCGVSMTGLFLFCFFLCFFFFFFNNKFYVKIFYNLVAFFCIVSSE